MTASNVLIFDVETTGTHTSKDQIIEIGLAARGRPAVVRRIKPSVPISPEAQEVHGISMDDLIACGDFSSHAEAIAGVFEWAHVLVGYNVQFDIAMVEAEMARAGHSCSLSDKIVVDPYRLWQQLEPRKLVDAHLRFVGRELKDAHGVAGDIAGTEAVLKAMAKSMGLKGKTWDELATICEPERANYVNGTRHFIWNEFGVACFGFGQHEGDPLEAHRDYIQWMTGQDFPQSARDVCRMHLEGVLGRRPSDGK